MCQTVSRSSVAGSLEMSAMDMAALPEDIVDCHHHFLEPEKNAFQAFLKGLGAPTYTCEQYYAECEGLKMSRSVHVEALPDDGVAEAEWVETLRKCGRAPKVAAVVAKADLSRPDAGAVLDALKAASPALKNSESWDSARSTVTRSEHANSRAPTKRARNMDFSNAGK